MKKCLQFPETEKALSFFKAQQCWWLCLAGWYNEPTAMGKESGTKTTIPFPCWKTQKHCLREDIKPVKSTPTKEQNDNHKKTQQLRTAKIAETFQHPQGNVSFQHAIAAASINKAIFHKAENPNLPNLFLLGIRATDPCWPSGLRCFSPSLCPLQCVKPGTNPRVSTYTAQNSKNCCWPCSNLLTTQLNAKCHFVSIPESADFCVKNTCRFSNCAQNKPLESKKGAN